MVLTFELRAEKWMQMKEVVAAALSDNNPVIEMICKSNDGEW
jgi:hypothetical protein